MSVLILCTNYTAPTCYSSNTMDNEVVRCLCVLGYPGTLQVWSTTTRREPQTRREQLTSC